VLPRARALRALGDARAAVGDVAGSRAAREKAAAITVKIDLPATAGPVHGP
jgi:hypothetical protein